MAYSHRIIAETSPIDAQSDEPSVLPLITIQPAPSGTYGGVMRASPVQGFPLDDSYFQTQSVQTQSEPWEQGNLGELGLFDDPSGVTYSFDWPAFSAQPPGPCLDGDCPLQY